MLTKEEMLILPREEITEQQEMGVDSELYTVAFAGAIVDEDELNTPDPKGISENILENVSEEDKK